MYFTFCVCFCWNKRVINNKSTRLQATFQTVRSSFPHQHLNMLVLLNVVGQCKLKCSVLINLCFKSYLMNAQLRYLIKPNAISRAVYKMIHLKMIAGICGNINSSTTSCYTPMRNSFARFFVRCCLCFLRNDKI